MNGKWQQLHFAESLKKKKKKKKSNPWPFTIIFTNINTMENTIKYNFVQFWVLNFKMPTRKKQKTRLHA